ncbi:hypothetical protein [Nitrospirillum sp. BR 11828]|uniref:hypothetical protein n=1 Tax=Nitrospirillum sp. BR 11828 TaxID=3104325 RepID=UPI002ACA7246|nr:hypothetical protein [Nitrospirillum sp. BR 11828]MDZ5648188.1 hypothetical protein [Nitrospirillum sp. BR 11828]
MSIHNLPEPPGILALIGLLKRSYAANVGVFFSLILMLAFILNCPGVLIEETNIIFHISAPALLLVGLLGSVLRIWPLRAVGWLGIIYSLPAVMCAAPDLDHFTPELQGFPTLWRLSLTASVWLALLTFFKVLAMRRWDGQRRSFVAASIRCVAGSK